MNAEDETNFINSRNSKFTQLMEYIDELGSTLYQRFVWSVTKFFVYFNLPAAAT